MMAAIYIEPHERYEAIEAYSDKLSPSQIEEIKDAPEESLIRLEFSPIPPRTRVVVEANEESGLP